MNENGDQKPRRGAASDGLGVLWRVSFRGRIEDHRLLTHVLLLTLLITLCSCDFAQDWSCKSTYWHNTNFKPHIYSDAKPGAIVSSVQISHSGMGTDLSLEETEGYSILLDGGWWDPFVSYLRSELRRSGVLNEQAPRSSVLVCEYLDFWAGTVGWSTSEARFRFTCTIPGSSFKLEELSAVQEKCTGPKTREYCMYQALGASVPKIVSALQKSLRVGGEL